MVQRSEEDISNEIMTIIQKTPGILVPKILQALNEGAEKGDRVIGQFIVSQLINGLVAAGKVRTVFLSGLVWRACYPSDFPVVLTIGEKKEANTSMILAGAVAFKQIEEGDY